MDYNSASVSPRKKLIQNWTDCLLLWKKLFFFRLEELVRCWVGRFRLEILQQFWSCSRYGKDVCNNFGVNSSRIILDICLVLSSLRYKYILWAGFGLQNFLFWLPEKSGALTIKYPVLYSRNHFLELNCELPSIVLIFLIISFVIIIVFFFLHDTFFLFPFLQRSNLLMHNRFSLGMTLTFMLEPGQFSKLPAIYELKLFQSVGINELISDYYVIQ